MKGRRTSKPCIAAFAEIGNVQPASCPLAASPVFPGIFMLVFLCRVGRGEGGEKSEEEFLFEWCVAQWSGLCE